MLSGVGLNSVVISNYLGDCGKFLSSIQGVVCVCECCMWGCTFASRRITPGAVLQATSTLVFGTGSLIGLDWRSRLGWRGLWALELCLSLIIGSVMLCSVLNLSFQTQVLMLSKQYVSYCYCYWLSCVWRRAGPRAPPTHRAPFLKVKFSSTLQRARQTWPITEPA